MESVNPFIVKGYVSKVYFCDRKNELKILKNNVKNNINTTLISYRKIGKTGLIYRFFDYLNEKKEDFTTIFVDILSARSLDDFVKLLTEAILKSYPEKTSLGKRFLKLLKGLRPLISYNSISGDPQVQISYQTPEEKEVTIRGLLEFLEKQDKKTVLAIDEFQQIEAFPEKNVEALLRTYIQSFNNIVFIFCGSKKTMMLDIFSNTKRPFFGMTQYLHLDKIDENSYSDFITDLFRKRNKIINNECVRFILNWTLMHTYYTQVLCNTLFSLSGKNIGIKDVKNACNYILQQNESVFLQYRQLLTSAQWNFLIAVAKEQKVLQPTAQRFLSKYNIGTPANGKRLSKSLSDKDLLLIDATFEEISYRVYDVFLMRWLQSKY
jgi:hypothetical protein